MSQTRRAGPADAAAAKTLAAWRFFQQMLADVTKIVTEDAESERELLEGLRVIARVSSLCSQLSVEADPDRPSFFDMCSDNQDDRRAESRWELLPGDDPRRPALPDHRHPRHNCLSRLSDPRRHRPDAAPDGQLRQRRRLGTARRRIRVGALGRRARRSGRCAVGEDSRRRVVGRRSGVHRRSGLRRVGHPAHRSPRSRAGGAADRRRTRRAVHRHGVDADETRYAAPHHQARAARPAQHPDDRGRPPIWVRPTPPRTTCT